MRAEPRSLAGNETLSHEVKRDLGLATGSTAVKHVAPRNLKAATPVCTRTGGGGVYRIRTDRAAFGGLLAAASIFILLCTAPGPYAAGGISPPIDTLLISSLIGGTIFTLLFAIGHALLRKQARGGRSLYVALGAASLVLAYASRTDIANLVSVFRHGLVAYFFFLPAVVGCCLGFLYALRAGWEEAELDWNQTTPGVADPSLAPVLIETDDTAYFSGPVRVRTSIALMLLAALMGGGALFASQALMGLVGEARMLSDQSAASVLTHSADVGLFFGVKMLGETLLGLIPITLCLVAGHFAARAVKTTATWAYFLFGFAAPSVIALLGPGPFMTLGLALALPTGISLALYRTFAGLEPVPVAEDVISSNPRDLVAADHPRRRYGRVVRQGR